jgi:hypothetical protein
MCSLNQIPAPALARIISSVALRLSSGSCRSHRRSVLPVNPLERAQSAKDAGDIAEVRFGKLAVGGPAQRFPDGAYGDDGPG